MIKRFYVLCLLYVSSFTKYVFETTFSTLLTLVSILLNYKTNSVEHLLRYKTTYVAAIFK